MNKSSRLDVFFVSLLTSLPYPVVYLLKTLLGVVAIPLIVVGSVVWGVAWSLHWIGDKAVRSFNLAFRDEP